MQRTSTYCARRTKYLSRVSPGRGVRMWPTAAPWVSKGQRRTASPGRGDIDAPPTLSALTRSRKEQTSMPRKRKQSDSPAQAELLDVTSRLRTAPCVPALREAVKAWRAGGYKGITDTTRELLNFWFFTDHRLPTGEPFPYHPSQQEAIETLIFVWEFEKIRTRKRLLGRTGSWRPRGRRLPTSHPKIRLRDSGAKMRPF